MTEPLIIFLAGGSRGVGREIARILRDQDYPVKALLRTKEMQPQLESMGITVAIGDAMRIEDVEQAMESDPPITTVISTIGGMPMQGDRPDYRANKHLIDVAAKIRVQHFILVSSIGVGDSAVAIAPGALETLGPVLVEKEKAEKYLQSSGLTYTIIRPGGLSSEAATSRGVLTKDSRISGTIHRADVAQLVCQCLTSDAAKDQVLSAIDRDLLYTQIPFVEYKLT